MPRTLPVNRTDRRERETVKPKYPLRPPEQVLLHPPAIPGTVEDSHAKLAAEMRAEAERAFSWTRGDGGRQIDVHPNYVEELASVIEEQAARVEALGRVEEKKAAAVAWVIAADPAWTSLRRESRDAIRALVESASKKEDALNADVCKECGTAGQPCRCKTLRRYPGPVPK